MEEEKLIELGEKIKDLLVQYEANYYIWKEVQNRVNTEYGLLVIQK